MGLEGTDHPPVSQAPGRGQQGAQLAGVVGVVVVHRRAVELPLVLKPSARPAEGPQAVPDCGEGRPQLKGRAGGGQSVAHIVDAGDTELDAPQILAPDDQVKGREPTLPGQPLTVDVTLLQAKGEHGPLQPPQGVHGVGVVPVRHHAALLRDQLRKAAEGVLHILQVLEEVQVVGVHIEDHRHGGEEGQEGVAVLTGLQNDGIPLPHPVSRAKGG